MSRDGLDRRRFLISLGGAIAAFALRGPAAGLAAAGEPGAPTLGAAALFDHLPEARAVGTAYLEGRGDEASAAALARALAASDPRWNELPADDAGALRRFARARIRRDYAEGRLVPVKGWLLAETEARLCALATFG